MNRHIDIVRLIITAGLLMAAGCSTLHKSDSATLQGTWKGPEIGAEARGLCCLIVSGKNLEFRGGNTNEWYKGTFSLREDSNPKQVVATITECPLPQYVGKTSYGIYRIEGETLTLAGNEPGRAEVPASFDAPGSRQFVLKHN